MKSSVNLLPLTFRRGELFRRRARQWGAWWAAAAVIGGAVASAAALSRDDAERSRLEAQRRLSDRLARSEKRVTETRAKLSALREQGAAFMNPVDEPPGLLVLGIVSRCAGRLEGAIHVEGLSYSNTDSASAAKGVPAAPARKDHRLLTLTGRASDGLAVAAFATGLRDSGAFASVERKSSPTPGAEEKPPVPYVLECRF